MMKIKLSFLILVFISCTVYCQEITRSVLACGGGDLTNSSAQISFTMGEPISGTCESSSCYVTIGFQQVYVEVSSINPEVTMFDLNVYPNPVNSYLNIEIDPTKNEQYNAILLDLNGKKIMEYKLKDNIMNIDVKELPQSIYILQIYNAKGNMQTFKLIKN